jgi:nucleotide-binding universal stress UspA family protein
MSTSDVQQPARPPLFGRSGAPRMLVASEGTGVSVSAMRMAAAVARHYNVTPRVLTVVEPGRLVAPGMEWTLAGTADTSAMRAMCGGRVAQVRAQIETHAGDVAEWPVDLVVGQPVTVIVDEVTRHETDLVVMGLRLHGLIDRLLGEETVVRVVRHCNAPVLAVLPTLTELPRKVLVGVDFSRSSIRAAHTALDLIAPGGKMFLAHVHDARDTTEGERIIRQQGVAAAFTVLRQQLNVPPGITVEPIVTGGTPSVELLSLASRLEVDLVAGGTHRHDATDRFIAGSVATTLIRAACCSMLITPPRVMSRRAAA